MKRDIVVTVAIIAFAITGTIVFAQSPKGPGFSGAAEPPGNWYGKSVALVVGIDNYQKTWPKLEMAVRDARQVSEALKSQGFEVYQLLDAQATKANILAQLSDVLPPKLGDGDRFVFYFSGHGDTETTAIGEKLGYIVPVDADRSFRSSAISMSEMKQIALSKYATKHLLFVADSCFSGLLKTRAAGKPSADANWCLAHKGKMVMTAGGEDEQVLDGALTPVLIDGLGGEADTSPADGYVTFGELAQYSKTRVFQRTNKQRPDFGWWDGSGEMVFNQGGQGQGTVSELAGTTPIHNTVDSMAQTASPTSPRIVRTSGQYQVTSCGSIIDTTTDLEWYVGQDNNTNWLQARDYIGGLTVCGGGWRMPSLAELKSLFQKEPGGRNMDLIFPTTGFFVWTESTRGSRDALGFDFFNGGGYWRNHQNDRGIRAFAVRSLR